MRTRFTAALLTAAAVLALASCGSGGGGTDPEPSRAAKEEGPGPVPSPDAAQTGKLIEELRAIDPRLAEPESRAVKGAVVTCEALVNGVPREAVAGTAASNFGGADGGKAAVDEKRADRIVTAVESSFCEV